MPEEYSRKAPQICKVSLLPVTEAWCFPGDVSRTQQITNCSLRQQIIGAILGKRAICSAFFLFVIILENLFHESTHRLSLFLGCGKAPHHNRD